MILEAAKAEILEGRTIDQIAAKHGIAHSTLEYWLSSLGDEYQELRKAWLDGMLIESGTLLKEARDALGLARARELWRRATWYAERRDRARYGQDAPPNEGKYVQINIGIRREDATPQRTIDINSQDSGTS